MRKSVSLYIVCFCLIIIVVVALVGTIWQPSFEEGVISISIMGSDVAYSLWGLLLFVIVLIGFIYMLAKAFMTREKRIPFYLAGIAMGVCLVILLDNITYGWTYYPGLSSLGQGGLSFETYRLFLLGIDGLIVLVIAFLVIRWVKLTKKSKGSSPI